jgi:hypothetical protein
MRGLDLNVFDFDYDLTWFALMLTPDGRELGRFGGRDEDKVGAYHSLRGLRHGLEQALERFRKGVAAPAVGAAPRRADDYPAARQLTAKACIHCHHVYEFQRSAEMETETWNREALWVYPQPRNVGLILDRDQGNRILDVVSSSPAARAGLVSGDTLRSLSGRPIASIADVQYALHRAPSQGSLTARWERQGRLMQAELTLAADWKKNDLSWRWSLKSYGPSPGVLVEDIQREDRQRLGLATDVLALRQQAYLSPEARQAGLRVNDILIGVDEHRSALNARQLETHLRLNYHIGDTINLHVLRGAERLQLQLRLVK